MQTIERRFRRKGVVGCVLSPERKSGTARFTRATCFAYWEWSHCTAAVAGITATVAATTTTTVTHWAARGRARNV